VEIKLSACDPLNLAGIILPGPRIPAVPSNFMIFRDGLPIRTVTARSYDLHDREIAQLSQGR
jgi:ATP-dependent Lhr-like helicase